MKPLYIAAGVAAAVVVAVLGFVVFPPAEPKQAEPAAAPVPVRYLPTAQLMRELSPFATRFPGEALGLPGGVCHVSISQPLERVVIVCK